MRRPGFSRKRPTLVHASRAGPDGARRWQATAVPGPRRLRDEGHTILAQDGPIFAAGAGRGAKHWSPVGTGIPVPRTGSHERLAVFGALADDGRRPFRPHGRLGAATFVRCPREAHRKFGRIAVVMGRAPQHRAAVVRDFLEGCAGEVALHGLPTGSPHTDAAEEPWRRARHAVRDPGRHGGAVGLRAAVGEHFRAARHRLDIFAYMGRRAADRVSRAGAVIPPPAAAAAAPRSPRDAQFCPRQPGARAAWRRNMPARPANGQARTATRTLPASVLVQKRRKTRGGLMVAGIVMQHRRDGRALGNAVPQQAARGEAAARACREEEAARPGAGDPRRAREGDAARDGHKEEKKAQGQGVGGGAHRVCHQHAVGRPGRAVPAQAGGRERPQVAEAYAHAHAGSRRERQDPSQPTCLPPRAPVPVPYGPN